MKIISANDVKTYMTAIKKRILIVEDQFIEAYDLQLILENANYEVLGIARSVEHALEEIEAKKPDLVLVDIMLKGGRNGIELAHILKQRQMGFIFISANSSKSILDKAKTTQPYGFIVKPFRDEDVLTTLEIAFYRHEYSLESQLMQQLQLQNYIVEILDSKLPKEEAWLAFARAVQNSISFDYLEVGFNNTAHYENLGITRKNIDDYIAISPEKLSKIASISAKELDDMHKESKAEAEGAIYDLKPLADNFQASPIKELLARNFGLKSYLVFPVSTTANQSFHFTFYSRSLDNYTSENLTLLYNIENLLNRFISKAYSKEEDSVKPKKNVFKNSKPLHDEQGIEGIIGNSPQMISVFNYVRKVAGSDTSVLVLGESGTGKEKIAQSIHNLSSRRDKPFVAINCGAIPENLAESILFGHEKGAFTGAMDKHMGKFQLAEGGTIFLDEIGEMSLDLQVKLLRVLQEKEIERVGSALPIKVDVRIIAATNKNLEEEVAAGRFRMDLYYRLYVFPIHVPSLKERKEDIPDLVDYFINMYCEKLGKKPLILSDFALQQIMNYNWPGNIRELEHVLHRAILLADGNQIREIELLAKSKANPDSSQESFSIKTIFEYERDYILYILKKCKGKISGPGGAAEILDINPSTLISKIKKLDIKKEHY